MPRPHAGESLHGYMARFMGSSEARSDFPARKQRAAVAVSMYKRAKKGQKHGRR